MRHQPLRARLLGAAISALAGYVDAVGFVSSGGYFVSFMSGNSTRLGVELGASFAATGIALLLITAFVGGAAAGTRWRLGHHERAGFVIIGLLLVASALTHDLMRGLAVGLAAFAMGALNTLAVRHAALPVGLTYMTGTLVKLGEALGSTSESGAGDAMPYLVHWLALVIGAALGATAFDGLGAAAMGIAAAGPLALALHRAR